MSPVLAPSQTCSQCHHPESDHAIEKKNWLMCLHPGCQCESYKGTVSWNGVDERLNEGFRKYGP